MKALSSTGWQGGVLPVRMKKTGDTSPTLVHPARLLRAHGCGWVEGRLKHPQMWYFEMVFTRYVGKFGMVSLYETLIHTASKALVYWLFPQQRQLQYHAPSGSESEPFITQTARPRSPRFGS